MVGVGTIPGRLQAVDPELTSRVLGCISVLRPYNVHDLLSLLDRLEVDLQQPQEQELALRGPQLVDGGKVPGGALRPRRAGPRLIIVDSVSALLSTVLGSNQHKQGGIAGAVGQLACNGREFLPGANATLYHRP